MNLTGRCYCGATTLTASAPLMVAYCHCGDCKRWTGGPVGAFAAFAPENLVVTPALGAPYVANKGVERWNCPTCHSPLAAAFDYLPGHIYVPVGILDQADALPPQLHCHGDHQISWLHLRDDLPRETGSGRDLLNTAPGYGDG